MDHSLDTYLTRHHGEPLCAVDLVRAVARATDSTLCTLFLAGPVYAAPGPAPPPPPAHIVVAHYDYAQDPIAKPHPSASSVVSRSPFRAMLRHTVRTAPDVLTPQPPPANRAARGRRPAHTGPGSTGPPTYAVPCLRAYADTATDANATTADIASPLPGPSYANTAYRAWSMGYACAYPLRRLLCVPLYMERRYVGVLCAANAARNYTRADHPHITPWCTLACVLVHQRRLALDARTGDTPAPPAGGAVSDGSVTRDTAGALEEGEGASGSGSAQAADPNKLAQGSDAPGMEDGMYMVSVGEEIRAPLHGVIGNTQILAQTALTDTQRRHVSATMKCALHLLQQVNDTLDYARLSAGRVPVREVCFEPRDAVDAAHSTMAARITAKGQAYTVLVDDDVPRHVVMDRRKLVHVLVNLLSNAHKFTGRGGSIAVRVGMAAADTMRVSIRDDGVGIDADHAKTLFMPYGGGGMRRTAKAGRLQETERQATDDEHATGMGLAICAKLVALLGGRISYTPNTGTGKSVERQGTGVSVERRPGTTFTFTARCKQGEAQRCARQADVADMKDRTVLVVAADAGTRIALTDTLFDWGAQPVVCAAMDEAMHMVAHGRYAFDVALLDASMAGMDDDAEAARDLRTRMPSIPTIALVTAPTPPACPRTPPLSAVPPTSPSSSMYTETVAVRPVDHCRLLAAIRRATRHRRPRDMVCDVHGEQRPDNDSAPVEEGSAV